MDEKQDLTFTMGQEGDTAELPEVIEGQRRPEDIPIINTRGPPEERTPPPKSSVAPAPVASVVSDSDPEMAGVLDKALTWACELGTAQDDHCPVCNADFTLGDLRKHIESQHLARVLVGFAHNDLDAVSRIAQDKAVADKELFETVGLDVDSDAGDHFNSFEIDPQLQKRLTADGSRLHWATPRHIPRYKRRGMEVVGGIAADGTFKGPETQFGSNEMVLMRIPARLVDIRQRVKQHNVDNVVVAKQEDQMRRIEGIQRTAHDTLAKRGYGADQIRNVISAVGRGLEKGVLRVRDQKGSRKYSV